MKIKTIDQENIEILYEEDNLRIHTISKVVNLDSGQMSIQSMPTTYGVGIEWCYNGTNYIVISFTQPNDNGKVYTKPVGNRVKDFCRRGEKNREFYQKIKRKAHQIVKEALKSGN